MKIAIVDYGVGNLFSVKKAFKRFTDNLIITEEAAEIEKASAIVLPGVGSFEAGVMGLEIRGLKETVKERARRGVPMLGICLGAQLMLSQGNEFGTFEGLNIIKGKVVRFPALQKSFKVPHVGWNEIKEPRKNCWQKTILEGILQNVQMYFVHSYILEPADQNDVLCFSEYGACRFVSAVKKDKIYGLQFHPEKSGQLGLKIIENFIKQIA